MTVQANLKIVLNRLTYIFLVWLKLTLYRVYKGHATRRYYESLRFL